MYEPGLYDRQLFDQLLSIDQLVSDTNDNMELISCYVENKEDRITVCNEFRHYFNCYEKVVDFFMDPENWKTEEGRKESFAQYVLRLSFHFSDENMFNLRFKELKHNLLSLILTEGNVKGLFILLQYGFPAKDTDKILFQGWKRNDQLIVFTSMIMAFLWSGTFDEQSYIEAYKLYMRAVPEKYVTEDEIILHNRTMGRNESIIEDILKTYKKYFPRMISKSNKPRSLKHLSRCTVRWILKEYNFLNASENILKLPNSMYKYINFNYIC